jgi:hypothetical protein
VNTTLLIVGVIFGAVILVAALKAAFGPDHKQHGQSDGGSGIGVSYTDYSRNDDSDSGGGDGGD